MRFNEGDRVMAIVGGGGQAELAVVHERMLMPVPEALSWAEAGGLPEVFTTAHDALFTQAGLETGERLLVHGGAGGVGTAAIQLGNASGARVSATVRNPDLRDQVSALGAEVLAPEGFADHGPFDVILELVGAPNLPDDVNALSLLGRITVIGIGAGATCELNLGALMAKRGRIHGSTLRSRPLEEKAFTARAMERSVLPLFESDRVRVLIAATIPSTRRAGLRALRCRAASSARSCSRSKAVDRRLGGLLLAELGVVLGDRDDLVGVNRAQRRATRLHHGLDLPRCQLGAALLTAVPRPLDGLLLEVHGNEFNRTRSRPAGRGRGASRGRRNEGKSCDHSRESPRARPRPPPSRPRWSPRPGVRPGHQ